MNEVNGLFGQQGWICPKCGRVFSPYTIMCPYCKKEETTNLPNIPPSGKNAQIAHRAKYDESII